MSEMNTNISETIKGHLRNLLASFGLDDSEESLETITQIWLEKENFFNDQIQTLGLLEADSFDKDDPRGALMLTYSGSLISLSSIHNSTRTVTYSSIKARVSVPEVVIMENVKVQNDTKIDSCLELENSPIKKTSSLYKIVVCKDDVAIEEQDKRISAAKSFLTTGFLKLNNSFFVEENKDIDNFTLSSMIKDVALKNDLSIKQTKQIIDDYFQSVQSGLMSGKKVSLGILGNISVKVKAPQKARVGKHPATGEEITIEAKPERAVPKFSFSSQLKNQVAEIKIKTK